MSCDCRIIYHFNELKFKDKNNSSAFLDVILQELCSSLISHLGKIRAHSQAFSVYNMLRYSKRTMCKALHEKILHILVAGRLLKDAYVVVKVCDVS